MPAQKSKTKGAKKVVKKKLAKKIVKKTTKKTVKKKAVKKKLAKKIVKKKTAKKKKVKKVEEIPEPEPEPEPEPIPLTPEEKMHAILEEQLQLEEDAITLYNKLLLHFRNPDIIKGLTIIRDDEIQHVETVKETLALLDQ